MRPRVIGSLSVAQRKLIQDRAWPCIRPERTPQEMVALAYIQGLRDGNEAIHD